MGQYCYCLKLKFDVAISLLQILNSVLFKGIQVLLKAPDCVQNQRCWSPRHQLAQADEFCTVGHDICSIIVAVFPLHTEMLSTRVQKA